jgi:hypothetical protein
LPEVNTMVTISLGLLVEPLLWGWRMHPVSTERLLFIPCFVFFFCRKQICRMSRKEGMIFVTPSHLLTK